MIARGHVPGRRKSIALRIPCSAQAQGVHPCVRPFDVYVSPLGPSGKASLLSRNKARRLATAGETGVGSIVVATICMKVAGSFH